MPNGAIIQVEGCVLAVPNVVWRQEVGAKTDGRQTKNRVSSCVSYCTSAGMHRHRSKPQIAII